MSELFSNLHLDTERFLQAVNYTAATTGFTERLIEKDYFCSLVLCDCASLFQAGYIFKGGTSLSKVHTKFYRMSEDLDFCFSTPPDATRRARRKNSLSFRQHFNSINSRLDELSVLEEIRGHNESRQYSGQLCYRSLITDEVEPIKVELSLREMLVEPPMEQNARTLLFNPDSAEHAEAFYPVCVMQLNETFAEKVRAALTRRSPEIRDYFDLQYAYENEIIQPSDTEFLSLVKGKLSLPGNGEIVSADTIKVSLQRQLETRLRPVLSEFDFTSFDLEKVLATVDQIRQSLRS